MNIRMKSVGFFILISFLIHKGTVCNAQDKNADGSLVKWMSIQEAVEANKKSPRPILMDFYTDW